MSPSTEDLDPRDPATNGLPADLPPVEPPSAGFIVQLFVIPAAIVAVVIVVWLLFGKLAGGERDAMDYVERIRSGNDKQRWRAAHELASLIGNDPRLAKDGALLGKLAGLLDDELRKEGDDQLKVYLAVALGVFQTLDVPSGGTADPLATLAKALAARQSTEVRRAAAESLAKQASRLDGQLDDPTTARALAEAGDDPEPELRKRATFALGFFGGDLAADALRKRIHDEDREVRYNAAVALGRRGDPEALPVFREMLSPADLARVVKLDNPQEKRNQIEAIELVALRALETSVQAGRPSLAQVLRREVTALTTSDLAGVRMEAEALLKSLPAPTPAPGT
jgi:hypothetical protein